MTSAVFTQLGFEVPFFLDPWKSCKLNGIFMIKILTENQHKTANLGQASQHQDSTIQII